MADGFSGLAQLWGLSGQLYGGAAPTDPQAALQAALQYDPNAHLESYSDFGDGGNTQQQLIFDRSKLPAQQAGMAPVPTWLAGGRSSTGGTFLANPNALYNDANYGTLTPSSNIRGGNNSTWLDTVGPLLVGGAIGLGGGFSMFGNLFSKLPNVASMVSNYMQQPAALSPQQIALYRALATR
jgi:hypothetical protein